MDELESELTSEEATIVNASPVRVERLAGRPLGEILTAMGLVEVDGKRIAFTHGHLARVMQDAINDGVDYLFYGHTHAVSDERCGRTRLINPGALFRAPRYTAALLDPAADHLRIIEVPKGPTG